MGKTAIEWTDETWNPVTGCAKVSPGCDNCYAERVALDLQRRGSARYADGFESTIHHDLIDRPDHWRKPRMVFVCSMSDLFQSAVPNDVLDRIWETMLRNPAHTFQVLTKRPQRMRTYLASRLSVRWGLDVVPPHIWIGTSIETNRYAFRAGYLRLIPAAVRFVSAEPLLGPVDDLDLDGIHWVIVGGESGPEARPMHPAWARDIRDRCHYRDGNRAEGRPHQERGTRRDVPAFFFKQWGEWVPATEPSFDGWNPESHWPDRVHEFDDVAMLRVGRRRDPKTLDGQRWLEMPAHPH